VPLAVEGEHLFAVERLVVSPGPAIFTPIGRSPTATSSTSGTVLGHVGEREVRLTVRRRTAELHRLDTERVTARQPIAWLRSTDGRAERKRQCQQSRPGPGAVITGWGTALPPKVLTNHDLDR
jgi:hypothetical protein